VFYNAAMALDRDLGVAVVRARWPAGGTRARGWEMLAATGVRGLRLLGESEAFAALWLTELRPEAVEVLAANLAARGRAEAFGRRWDATAPLPEGPFDYVDLDPYGTPVPFLASALASVRDGGLLAVTATDMPVLAGVQRRACELRYGATPIRGRLGPEAGLRILLAFVDRAARGRGRSIRPLLAYVLDHHVRLYAEVGPAQGPERSTVLGSDRPDLPELPGPGPFGPLWTGPLFDPEFVARLAVPPAAERPRELARLLERFAEESGVPSVLWYEGNRLAQRTGVAEPPPLGALLAELRRLGFRAARAHPHPGAFRTDAPRARVEEACRRLAAGTGGASLSPRTPGSERTSAPP
jgi:tRNA (guanine26-N2/guanine27-N2)-dimethyltransferase